MKGKIFDAPLQGRMVECVSADDALDVRAANLILRRAEPNGTTSDELERLAAVLLRYGRASAAEKLNERAKQMRAAQFLTDALDNGAWTGEGVSRRGR